MNQITFDTSVNEKLEAVYRDSENAERKLFLFAAWLAVLGTGLGVILIVGGV